MTMLPDILRHLEALVSFDTRNPPRRIGTGGMFDYLRAQLAGFRLEVTDHERLLLLARAWPAGHAHVDISLRAQADSTLVTITEDATAGPGLLVPKPLRDLQLHPRNVETLKRLAFVVEGRTR